MGLQGEMTDKAKDKKMEETSVGHRWKSQVSLSERKRECQ